MSDKSLLFGNQPAAQQPSPTAGLFGEASTPAATQSVKDVTTAGFAADVIQESRRQPVLVDFWAPWCGPCKQLAPALEKAVAEAGGRVRLVKMNIDEHPSIAGQLGIQSIPAVIAFKNGQPVDGFMGAVPESQIKEFIARVAGNGPDPELGDAIKAAQEAQAQGDLQTAMQLFDAVLSQAPDNLDAIAGLAGILYDAGDAEAAQEVLAMAPEGKGDNAALASLKAKMALAEEAAKLGDPAALQRRLAADPNDHQARFDLAMIQNALGNRADAAESLLSIVKADRTWNEDGARAQLLRFFEAWGPTDPATLSARRRLSSLLFS
ncbi:thioredoxin [Mesorhizobium sp. RP14(2022)]|uniref:Thioredoxin n=1 Tax=Mesorhizobium liriopis TaxID=2953882 RepID=A0ABT1CAI8_9HYPH|nr:thioredoxin [Mesorhizobium liriopis]MCO6050991.1 thioredoxin [Mesorhizobium liriopis]